MVNPTVHETQRNATALASWGAGAGCLPPDFRRPGGRVASRSRAPFPSLSLGSARPPSRRLRALSTTGSHKEGTRDERLSTRS